MSKFLKLSLFFGFFISVFVLSNSVYAHAEDSTETTSVTTSATPEKTRENQVYKNVKASEDKAAMKEAKISKAMERKANKLSEARLKVCQAREEKIESRFKNLITLGEKNHSEKEKIVERVDNFYTTKLVPNGYTLPNYAALKEDITTKQAAVKAAMETAQATGQDFSCDSEDPKAQADEFKTNVQALMTANKAYKASVKTFVVAVRDLAKKAHSTSSGSATKADKISPSPVISGAVSPEVTETP